MVAAGEHPPVARLLVDEAGAAVPADVDEGPDRPVLLPDDEDAVAGQVDRHEVAGVREFGDVGGEDRHLVEDPVLLQPGDVGIGVDGRVDQHRGGGLVAGGVVDVLEQAHSHTGVAVGVEQRGHAGDRRAHRPRIVPLGCHPVLLPFS